MQREIIVVLIHYPSTFERALSLQSVTINCNHCVGKFRQLAANVQLKYMYNLGYNYRNSSLSEAQKTTHEMRPLTLRWVLQNPPNTPASVLCVNTTIMLFIVTYFFCCWSFCCCFFLSEVVLVLKAKTIEYRKAGIFCGTKIYGTTIHKNYSLSWSPTWKIPTIIIW